MRKHVTNNVTRKVVILIYAFKYVFQNAYNGIRKKKETKIRLQAKAK